ncbi:hypothetical protein [Streptomyces sp. AC550_RSS872]|uniref:hypothetical protein n=1 Tax=Streptomyces sp. AC550_RSS872 TaxID=2823689 RepID=UPI001C261479|nr:hypothetical protein [Streptomyces sp. AC550_RSS872]
MLGRGQPVVGDSGRCSGGLGGAAPLGALPSTHWSALLSGERAAGLPTVFALEALANVCPTRLARPW